MSKKKPLSIICLLFWVGFTSPVCAATLEYSPRYNRNEGIKTIPVSGSFIELISVLADFREKKVEISDHIKIKFYLESLENVYVTVRELDNKHYYWMDKVKPSSPWKQGFANVFEWPTEEVIKQIKGLQIYDLGVIARIKKKMPSKKELVAPVILYHSSPPSKITAYRFTLKTNVDVRLTSHIYKEGSNKHLFKNVIRRQRAGRSFTLKWNSEKVGRGFYRLVIKGFLLKDSSPIGQTVVFYHKPIVE